MNLFNRKPIFDEGQNQQMVEAIRDAEKMTSGEIRVFIELNCKYVDPMHRARELFYKLDMHKTAQHNGVLLYVALDDRQFAILGDEGIHQKVGDHFWEAQADTMRSAFKEGQYIRGISAAVRSVGASLKKYFPHQSDDQNELPDDIVYG